VGSGDELERCLGSGGKIGWRCRAGAAEGQGKRQCRGELEGNDSPQALWVFSKDACSVYGIEHLNIVDAVRTDPVGKIVLASETRNVKLKNGGGLLLRVNAASHD
jgi:hypothetical protein